jgi:PEP-CTERM motif-containing protein
MRQSLLISVSSSAAGSLAVRAAMVVGLALGALASTSTKVEATSLNMKGDGFFDWTYYFNDANSVESRFSANNAIEFDIVDPAFDFTDFTLDVRADPFTALDFSHVPDGADLICLPYSFSPPGRCIQYTVLPSSDYHGPANANSVLVTIGWLRDTSQFAPTEESGKLLKGPTSGDYNSDITLQFFPQSTLICFSESCDSGITGETDNFSKFAVAYDANAAVPEPATLVLLGTGLLAAARARRYKNKSRP